MTISPPQQWAEHQFGHADLGDPRRTQRLVTLATSLATKPGWALSKSTSSPADMEGAYRFIRNEHIAASEIAQAGYQATAQQAKDYDTLLALEDTTTLSFKHASVRDELGHTNQGNKNRALQVHSVLLFAPEEHAIVGLIEQQRWARDIHKRGQKHFHAQRAYKTKESYKWETASIHMQTRLGELMSRTISVCDREADIFEYLTYKTQQQQRFVVRSMQSRCIEEDSNKLYAFASTLKSAGQRTVKIDQKGGRKARTVSLQIKYAPITLKVPANKKGDAISLYYVGCIEKSSAKDALSWHLLTSEPIHHQDDAQRIVQYYEQRWLIEDYHKAWKTGGTQVESLRMQSKANLERLAVILAFIATRILQLRFIKEGPDKAQYRCDQLLSTTAWKLLWLKMENQPLPKAVPDINWAYNSLAKLAGWKDTKRNGRAACKTLWEGWFKLQTILEGYELALSLETDL